MGRAVGNAQSVYNLSYPKEEESECGKSSRYCPEVYTAINGILFIAEHKKRMEESTKVTENKQKLKGDADKLLQQTLRFLLMNIL